MCFRFDVCLSVHPLVKSGFYLRNCNCTSVSDVKVNEWLTSISPCDATTTPHIASTGYLNSRSNSSTTWTVFPEEPHFHPGSAKAAAWLPPFPSPSPRPSRIYEADGCRNMFNTLLTYTHSIESNLPHITSKWLFGRPSFCSPFPLLIFE